MKNLQDTSSSKNLIRGKFHYVLSTHWDREWYQSFQNYRARLVNLLDGVIDGLTSGKLRGPFTCDGQSIILEDYLEVRPERGLLVHSLVAEGKLVVGPWYVLPDEFLISGESMIRNLRYGREFAREFGGIPSNAGFVCDLFGHCSQLPQIMSGFGITAAIVWRGLEPLPQARFWWSSPDGTSLPSIRFGKSGYCDYAFKVRQSHLHEVEFDEEKARKDLVEFLEEEAARVGNAGPYLVFDGADHLEPDSDHYRILCETADRSNGDYQIIHSSLDKFFTEMAQNFDDVTKRITGELRAPAASSLADDQQWLIPGVGSSRVWIKQQNAYCQNILCQWAEPFSAMATLLAGKEWPESYLRIAWRWLMQNHPHDSICGCSIDQVHEDMKYRFNQCRQIAEGLTNDALTFLTASVEGDIEEREIRVGVFNPLPKSRNEVIELTLDIPKDWPTFAEFFGFEQKPAFRIFTSDGQEVSYQRLSQRNNQLRKRIRAIKFPEAVVVNEVTVAVRLNLLALGYTTLKIVGDKQKNEDAQMPAQPLAPIMPTRHSAIPGLAISGRELENAFLRVTVEHDGSLTLFDKRSRETYSRLLVFEDGADIGDGWYHGPAVNDQHFSSVAGAVDVAVTTNGPILSTLRIRHTMRLPNRFDQGTMTRSADFESLILDNYVTLRSDRAFCEVRTKVTNTVCDHRLKVLFPSGAVAAETFLTDSPFDVVERPIALDANNHLFRELEVESKPQQTWTAVHNSTRGLAIVCDGGLLESGVRDVPERPIILTLYRSTSKTVLTSGEPEGQLLGHVMEFRYRIVPFAGCPDTSNLFDLASDLSSGIKSVTLQQTDVKMRRGEVPLSPEASLIEVEGTAVMTSLRKVGDATEVRLFNPENKEMAFALRTHTSLPVGEVASVDFESNSTNDSVSSDGSRISADLPSKRILTLSFR